MPYTASSDEAAQEQAFNLRLAGSTYPAIAEVLGYRTANLADCAIRQYERRTGRILPRSARRSSRVGPTAILTRRFGIEIEFNGLDPYRAVEALRAAGLEATYEGYTHEVMDCWKIVSDSSCGYEAVSPILRGEDGYAEVGKAMRALRGADARVDRRCGMHVHHEVVDLDAEALASIIESYYRCQGTLDRFVAASRRSTCVGSGNQYCPPMTASYVEQRAAECRDNGRPSFGDKFRTLNVGCYSTYGTFEFRQHQGTLNPRKAVAWVMLGQAMVVAAMRRQPVLPESFLNDLAAVGLPAVQVRHLTRRAETFGFDAPLATAARPASTAVAQMAPVVRPTRPETTDVNGDATRESPWYDDMGCNCSECWTARRRMAGREDV